MNKQLLSILSVVVSFGAALALYLYFSRIDEKSIKPVQVVPENAALIIESKQSHHRLKTLADPTFMQRLLTNRAVADLYSQLLYADSLLMENTDIGDWFDNGQAVYSFHAFENGSTGFFMAVQTGEEIVPESALGFLNKHFPARFRVTPRRFKNETIYDVVDFKGDFSFSAAFKSKLFLFSKDGSLVEAALIRTASAETGEIAEDKLNFIRNSGDGFNLQINYRMLAMMLKNASENGSQDYPILGNFAERAEYNITLDDEDMTLTGAAQTHETNFQFLDLLNAQAPIPNTLHKLLPEGLNFSLTFGFNGFESWFRNVNEYLLSRKKFVEYKGYVDSVEKSIQFKYSSRLASEIGNHAALLSLAEPGVWKDSSYVIAVEAKNASSFAALLKEMERARQIVYPEDSLPNEMDTLEWKDKTCLGKTFSYFFTDVFEGLDVRYYTQNQEYFFFAGNPSIIKALNRKFMAGAYQHKVENYSKFEDRIIAQSNLELLVFNDQASRFALNFVNRDLFSLINKNIGTLQKAQWTAIQFAGSNDKIFATQIYTRFNTRKTEKTEKVWSIPLDTLAIGKPGIIHNHSLGSQVILVQDAANMLYMIDREGKIIWKKKLSYPVISNFEQIDLYKNGRSQILFNTAHSLHLIDEGGQDIAGWPVWIATGTSWPATITDIYKDNNYQFFATGLFFKVSGYSAQGRLLAGWNPRDVWPNLRSNFTLLNFKGQSVLAALHEKGQISYFTPDGHSYTGIPSDSSVKWYDAHIEQTDTGTFTIAAIDSNYFYLRTISSTKTPRFKSIPAPGYKNIKVTESGYLLTSESRITLLDHSGKVIMDRLLTGVIATGVTWTMIGNSFQLAYCDQTSGNLYVQDIKGENYKPFPMQTSGVYIIGNLFNEFDTWLISAGKDGYLNLYKVK